MRPIEVPDNGGKSVNVLGIPMFILAVDMRA